MSFLESARSLIGTPFHWHQRTPGSNGGVDCLGLIIVAMRLSGTIDPEFDFLEYGNAEYDLDGLLQSDGDPYLTAISSPVDGAIVTLRIGGQVRHLGIIDGQNVIHVHQIHGVRLDPWPRWSSKLSTCYEVGKWQASGFSLG